MHKIANLPPAGNVQDGMRIQLKFLSKGDWKMEEMQRRASKSYKEVGDFTF